MKDFFQKWIKWFRDRASENTLSQRSRLKIEPKNKKKSVSEFFKKLNYRLVGFISGIAVVIILMVVFITLGVRNVNKIEPTERYDPVADLIAPPDDYVPPPNIGEENAEDISRKAVFVESSQQSVDIPGVFEDQLVYSAGTGPFEDPVLKTLYIYDISTGTESEIAQSVVDGGEIYEARMNENWIVWVDTDQEGVNQVYARRRDSTEADNMLIKECEYQKPKLRLHGDTLVWVEQTSEDMDRIFIVDLDSGEDLALMDLTEQASYGVSAPSIYDEQVIWAAPDTKQTAEDAEKYGENSAIYCCNLMRLGDDNAEETALSVFRPGTYVHEPVNNKEAWAWIDRNKAPDSGLFVRYAGDVVEVVRGNVTTYGLGEDFLVYGRNETVWAYFYKTKTYVRLSPEDEKAKLPVVNGNRVVWFIESDDVEDKLRTIRVDSSVDGGVVPNNDVHNLSKVTPMPSASDGEEDVKDDTAGLEDDKTENPEGDSTPEDQATKSADE